MTESVSPTAGTWIELAVEADHEAVESVAELFAQHGYNNGVAIEEPFLQEQDGDNVRVDLSRHVTIRTYLPAEQYDDAVLERVRTGLWHLSQMRSVGELRIESRHEEDWASAWKEFYRPLRVSERFVVRPPWFDYEPTSNELVLVLDPGMAFGTGTHPTTRLALRQVEQHVKPQHSVIDVGTGSGILALAAQQLGAAPIHGVDTDAMAVRVARGNLAHNGAEQSIRLEVGSLEPDDEFQGPYDVVIANIIARVLIELSTQLRRRITPGGLLLLSGIIVPKEPLVREAFEPHGLQLEGRDQIEDWVSLTYRLPA